MTPRSPYILRKSVCLLKIEGSEGVYEIQKIIMHEKYGLSSDAGYDIALLYLASDLEYSADVRPICLPDNTVPEWSNNVAIGWGETQG